MKRLEKEVFHRVMAYIVGALGLVAGLAWNDAIKALLDYLFPQQNSLPAKFLYAGLVSLLIILVTIYLVRLMSDESSSKKS